MQHIYKRFSVIAGFTALLAVLLISTAITRRRVDVLERNQSWVEHTQQVLLELSTVESLLKDAETGQRGFLYTGEESYLEPYNAAIKLVGAHVDKLAELTADNPRQQARMPMLRRLTQQKLDELARTIAMFNQGDPEQTKSLVRSDLGKLIMDNIRALADEMRQEEDSLETARLQSAASSTQALILTLYLNTGAAMAGLVLLAFFILREMAQREKHAAEIREREEWFRVTLGSIGDAVIATDERGTVIFVNPIAEELLGVKLREAQGQAIQKIFPIFNEQTRQPVENPVGKVLELGRVMGLANHTVLVRSDGKIIPIEDSAAPIFDDQKRLRGVVMVFRDVTLEKQSQEIMRKAEKLAAAGRLAATVAHEINNPLEAVCNLVYLATRAANVPEDVRGYLSMAEQELERVFYTAWGHDQRTFGNPGFHNLVERGIRWACGQDPAVVPEFASSAAPRFEPLPMTPIAEDAPEFTYVDVGPKIPNYRPGERWGLQGTPHTQMQMPLSPAESMQHYSVPRGFHLELFASEPDFEGKPIAMSWDERGRLWICETLDYPNELQPPGEGRDRIRICEDTDGDGRADRFAIFAEKLSIPTAIAFCRGGAIVQNATQTLYLKDTDGDDKADVREVLIRGWALGDTHGGVSNFQYGLDNSIWAMQGYNASTPEYGDGQKSSTFRQGFFRFQLGLKGAPEAAAGGLPVVTNVEFIRSSSNNTWGFGMSEEGLIFGSTANRNPSMFMPIANRYYERVRGWSAEQLGMIADTYLFKAITDKVRQVDQFGGYTAGAGHALYTARRYPQPFWNQTAD